MSKSKIVFVNRIDNTNTGDIWSSPLLYYSSYFKNFNISRQDIDTVDAKKILSSDIVIIGGGGLFNAFDKWNKNVNAILETGAEVIVWGIGYNSHYDFEKAQEHINTNNFKLLTIRDFNHPTKLDWLPCVSCAHPNLSKQKKVNRKFAIIEHKNYKIEDRIFENFERITNSHSIEVITDFIATSEIIITNTYHITYWAQLMQKKVIVVGGFSSKFEYFKYKPIFYSGDLEKDISSSKIISNALSEAQNLNRSFFNKVQEIINNRVDLKAKRSTRVTNQMKLYMWKNETSLRKYIKLIKKLFPNLHRDTLKW